jgi:hypothetical protein
MRFPGKKLGVAAAALGLALAGLGLHGDGTVRAAAVMYNLFPSPGSNATGSGFANVDLSGSNVTVQITLSGARPLTTFLVSSCMNTGGAYACSSNPAVDTVATDSSGSLNALLSIPPAARSDAIIMGDQKDFNDQLMAVINTAAAPGGFIFPGAALPATLLPNATVLNNPGNLTGVCFFSPGAGTFVGCAPTNVPGFGVGFVTTTNFGVVPGFSTTFVPGIGFVNIPSNNGVFFGNAFAPLGLFPGSIFPGTVFPGTIFPGTLFPGSLFPGTFLPGTIFPGTFPGFFNLASVCTPGSHATLTVIVGPFGQPLVVNPSAVPAGVLSTTITCPG